MTNPSGEAAAISGSVPNPGLARRAAALRERREELGHTQATVAKVMGFSRSTLERIELGKRNVNRSELRALLKFYGLDEAAQRPPFEQHNQSKPPRLWATYEAYLSPRAPNPALALRRVAYELRRLREEQGMPPWQVERDLRWRRGTLDKVEEERIGVSEQDLIVLLELYRVDVAARDRLLRLRHQAARLDRLAQYCSDLSSEHLRTYELTDAATRIKVLSSRIPSLLQTKGYAHALAERVAAGYVERGDKGAIPKITSRLVTLTEQRQLCLERSVPPNLHVILLEDGLQQLIDREGAAIFYEQLHQLTELPERPNVTVQLWPAAQAAPALGHGPAGVTLSDIVTVEFADPSDPPGWYSESLLERDHTHFSRLRDDPETVNRLLALFGDVAANALDPDESRLRFTAMRDNCRKIRPRPVTRSTAERAKAQRPQTPSAGPTRPRSS